MILLLLHGQGSQDTRLTAADQGQPPQQLASALRFDLDGHCVGLQQGHTGDVQPGAHASLRDPLRHTSAHCAAASSFCCCEFEPVP